LKINDEEAEELRARRAIKSLTERARACEKAAFINAKKELEKKYEQDDVKEILETLRGTFRLAICKAMNQRDFNFGNYYDDELSKIEGN